MNGTIFENYSFDQSTGMHSILLLSSMFPQPLMLTDMDLFVGGAGRRIEERRRCAGRLDLDSGGSTQGFKVLSVVF